MIKILVISSHSPLKQSGLGGHTKKVLNEFNSFGYDVTLLTTPLENEPTKNITIPLPWGISKIPSFLKIIREGKYSHVFMQYTPYIWGGRAGINFAPALFSFFLKIFSSAKLIIFFHEVEHPPGGSLRTLIINFSHRLMAFFLLRNSSLNFFSCKAIFDQAQNLAANLQLSPILCPGSNIEFFPITQSEREEIKRKFPAQKKLLILFGGHHESRQSNLFLNYYSKLQTMNDYHLVIIGSTKDSMKSDYHPELLKGIENNFTALGWLSESEVSKHLQVCDAQICYYEDGASLRRGTILAAISHLLPCLTTRSKNTDKELFAVSFLRFTSTNMRDFVEEIPRFIADLENIKKNKYHEIFKDSEEIQRKYIDAL